MAPSRKPGPPGVEWHFTATAPNKLCQTDLTEHPIGKGTLHLWRGEGCPIRGTFWLSLQVNLFFRPIIRRFCGQPDWGTRPLSAGGPEAHKTPKRKFSDGEPIRRSCDLPVMARMHDPDAGAFAAGRQGVQAARQYPFVTAGAGTAGSFGLLVAVAADSAVWPPDRDFVVFGAAPTGFRPLCRVAGFTGSSHLRPAATPGSGGRSARRV